MAQPLSADSVSPAVSSPAIPAPPLSVASPLASAAPNASAKLAEALPIGDIPQDASGNFPQPSPVDPPAEECPCADCCAQDDA
jgi:hypothetical protein